MNSQIILREAQPEDIEFIFSSWLKSYRGSLLYSKVQSSVYFPEMHKVIEKLLQNFPVIVACSSEDSSQIYGWICAGHIDSIFTLHYVYVKHTFRKLGIAKLLFNSFKHEVGAAGFYTHTSKLAEQLSAKYNMVHNPFLLINHLSPEVTITPAIEQVEVSKEEYKPLEDPNVQVDNDWRD